MGEISSFTSGTVSHFSSWVYASCPDLTGTFMQVHVDSLKCVFRKLMTMSFVLQGKQKDGSPFGEYGGWYKACKVDRSVFLMNSVFE